jgi:hypothetical protein
MRGYQAPGRRPIPTDMQTRFASLSRGRRQKLAKAAGTTLLKADQWAHGGVVAAETKKALETALDKLKKPGAPPAARPEAQGAGK